MGKKAWEQPLEWTPQKPCDECDGTGMGPRKTYHYDSLVDWDDCDRCEGTGEEPKDGDE
jgi:DnaJ-class molecular chaperone